MSQISNLKSFQEKNRDAAAKALNELRDAVIHGKNIFAELMNTTRYASMGQITKVLYEVGGKYRRNM